MSGEESILTHEVAATLVASAILAPSSHNSQPWLFRVRPAGIDLLADRTRALPAGDPNDRELTISCACALFNLRVAAAHAQLSATVRERCGGADPDCLATLEVSPATAPDTALAALADAMALRRTYRHTFADRPVAAAVLVALAGAAAQEGAWLQVLESRTQRQQAAELVAEGDEDLWADPAWRRELASWLHPRRRGDGLALPGLTLPVAQAVVRTFDMGYGVAARDIQLADASPVLAVLGTAGDGVADWLAAGQALQRLLLTAVQHGLQASYLNQPIQVASLRTKLRQLTGRHGFAQLLLRLGHADSLLPATPRRPLEEVIETGD